MLASGLHWNLMQMNPTILQNLINFAQTESTFPNIGQLGNMGGLESLNLLT